MLLDLHSQCFHWYIFTVDISIRQFFPRCQRLNTMHKATSNALTDVLTQLHTIMLVSATNTPTLFFLQVSKLSNGICTSKYNHCFLLKIINLTDKTINIPAADVSTLSNKVTSNAITDVMPQLLGYRINILQDSFF